ncbi:MAG: hypothetical protein AB7I27_04505 [Bacteriovoracaceae bacterium]
MRFLLLITLFINSVVAADSNLSFKIEDLLTNLQTINDPQSTCYVLSPNHQFCTESFKATCEKKSADSNGLLELQKKLRSQFPIDQQYNSYLEAKKSINTPEGKDRFLLEQDSLVSLIIGLENQIFSKYQLSPKDLETHIVKIKNSINTKIMDHFSSLSKEDTFKLVSMVNSVNVYTLQNLPSGLFPTYLSQCGHDGLKQQAFYQEPPANALIVCAGFILNSLWSGNGSFNSLSFVIAHELGHSIDFATKNIPTKVKVTYDNILNCVNKNFIQQPNSLFKSRSQIILYYQDKVSNYNQELLKASNQIPLNTQKISTLRDRIQILNSYIVEMKSHDENVEMIHFQRREIMADYFGNLALGSLLQNIPLNDRASFLASNIRFSCDKEGDLEHPHGRFRIENIFRNPDVRRALFCAEVEDTKWCDLN